MAGGAPTPADTDVAGAEAEKTEEHREERALAGAVVTEKRQDLAAADVERDRVESEPVPERLRNVVDLDHAGGPSPLGAGLTVTLPREASDRLPAGLALSLQHEAVERLGALRIGEHEADASCHAALGRHLRSEAERVVGAEPLPLPWSVDWSKPLWAGSPTVVGPKPTVPNPRNVVFDGNDAFSKSSAESVPHGRFDLRRSVLRRIEDDQLRGVRMLGVGTGAGEDLGLLVHLGRERTTEREVDDRCCRACG